jgi:hypothetical protein
MVATVHIADVGVRTALGVIRKPPAPGAIPGLRHADVAIAAPLRSRAISVPQPGRVGLVAFWDDDDAIEQFETTHPLGATLGGGWRVRLEPLRAWGAWPGLDPEVTKSRGVTGDGPVVVLTLGRLRLTQTVRFFRTSGPAERAATQAPGLIWATALARPPFVATCSVWKDAHASAEYAFAHAADAHPRAISADRAKAFHHQEAFIRFRPYTSTGTLAGTNPLPHVRVSATEGSGAHGPGSN